MRQGKPKDAGNPGKIGDIEFMLQPETITFNIVETPRWGVQKEVSQDAFPGVSTCGLLN